MHKVCHFVSIAVSLNWFQTQFYIIMLCLRVYTTHTNAHKQRRPQSDSVKICILYILLLATRDGLAGYIMFFFFEPNRQRHDTKFSNSHMCIRISYAWADTEPIQVYRLVLITLFLADATHDPHQLPSLGVVGVSSFLQSKTKTYLFS